MQMMFFDIYERAVGGNSVFLLNIPPTREGLFGAEDVRVLEEVGKRIKETYHTDLLSNATGPNELLDEDERTFMLGENEKGKYVIDLRESQLVNRFVLQEAIASHSQRIEEHALDAWIEGDWKQVASGTTIGHKKILRFPGVKTSKFRIRILKSRLDPTLSKVSAHYYRTRPPQIEIKRDQKGIVILTPKKHHFMWKSHGIDATANLNANLEIRYTTDGSKPTENSALYTGPIQIMSGEVKAAAFDGDETGGETSTRFGILKQDWSIVKESSRQGSNNGKKAIDDDPETYWQSKSGKKLPQSISIDLGSERNISGFAYTPQTVNGEGMMEKGNIFMSENGKKWNLIETFEFGNLINDPTKRFWNFKSLVNTRFIKVTSTNGAGGSSHVAIAELDFFTKD